MSDKDQKTIRKAVEDGKYTNYITFKKLFKEIDNLIFVPNKTK